MKKFTSSILIAAMLSVSLPLTSQAPCVLYHRTECGSAASEAGFMYNSQSKSGLFAPGTTSKLKCIFYEGLDYSITICAEKALGDGIGFTLTDAKTGELLYDNATEGKSPHMEFSCETTRNMVITVTVPGAGPKKGKTADGACLGILIEQKKTPKVGF
ncbi:MAG: hypothetical protein Fur0041_17280 [Bacteroidia bacterium]